MVEDAGIYRCLHRNSNLYSQAELIIARKSMSKPLHLGGDGSYDSPGFSARYCNYLIMDLTTKHILSFFTAIKFQVKSKIMVKKQNPTKNQIITLGPGWFIGNGALCCKNLLTVTPVL